MIIHFTSCQKANRPDIVASKLYGDPDLHWVFFLVNEFENYYDWFKSSRDFENYITKRYGGKYFVCDSSTDIVSATSKFLIGETITGANSKGIVVDVDPTMCRIGVDVEKGFVDPILSTGSSSSKSVTPTSIIDMKDGGIFTM